LLVVQKKSNRVVEKQGLSHELGTVLKKLILISKRKRGRGSGIRYARNVLFFGVSKKEDKEEEKVEEGGEIKRERGESSQKVEEESEY